MLGAVKSNCNYCARYGSCKVVNFESYWLISTKPINYADRASGNFPKYFACYFGRYLPRWLRVDELF